MEEDNQRKTRVFIDNEKRSTIKRMWIKGESTGSISSATDLSIRTIYREIKKLDDAEQGNIVELNTKPGPKLKNYTDDIARILEIVGLDNSFTQRAIKERVNLNGYEMSKATVCRIMKKGCITRKRLKRKSQSILTNDLISKRAIYASEYLARRHKRFIFLDETGFNLNTSINYGYSLSGTDAILHRPADRGRNISVCAIVSMIGIESFETRSGSFNSLSFLEFLTRVNNEGVFTNDTIVVMDNVRFHHSNIVKDFLISNRIEYLYLPPYTPECNPIELVFSVVKSRLDRVRPRPSTRETLTQEINRIFTDLRNGGGLDFRNFYSNMMEYITKAYNNIPF